MRFLEIFVFACLVSAFCSVPALPAALQEEPITKKSIVVLDFENLNKGDDELAWLSAGMAEAILTKLRNIKSLKLIERKQVLKAINELNFSTSDYFDKDKSEKLADFLRADVIIVGSFQEFRDRIRIFARFVDLKTTEVIDAAEVRGKLDDIFDLQDQIALKLMDKMGVETTEEERRKITEEPTKSLSAYEYYSKAISLPHETEEQFQKRISLLQKAIEQDPTYKEAYNDLAVAYMDRKDYEEALTYLQKAIQADIEYYIAHYNIGLCHENLGNYKEAMSGYQTCIELEPEYLFAYTGMARVAELRGSGEP